MSKRRNKSISARQKATWKRELEMAYQLYCADKLQETEQDETDPDEALREQILPQGLEFFEPKLSGQMLACPKCDHIDEAAEFEPELFKYVTLGRCPECNVRGYVLLDPSEEKSRKRRPRKKSR